jgi:SAM-dependent methyltransferase
MESLAALGAHLRIESESLDADPGVAALLAAVAEELGVDGASPQERQAVLGFIRAFVRQAADLIDDPGRPAGWSYDDPVVLQSIGRGSASIAGVIASVAPRLTDLDARLHGESAAILDVGVGTGWLAMALAERYTSARVVGLDVWEPALTLARENVARSTVADRVELRNQDATALDDVDRFDLAWLACPFLSLDVVAPAVGRTFVALRPGGWIVLGLFAGPDDPLAARLTELRTVRSGGHAWTANELLAIAAAAGFADTHEVTRTWSEPLRLVVGRRA